MKRTILECEQGSDEWRAARMGMPTASRFADIVTPTGKATKNAARDAYRNQLLGERLTGQLMTNFTTAAMQRGTDLEKSARSWYFLDTGRPVKETGLIILDGGIWKCGASPDGICEDRGIEIKCPLTHNMIAQLLEDGNPDDYDTQIQACMWITGLKRWDLILFSDSSGMPRKVYEMTEDEEMHAAFEVHIPEFCAELAECEALLIGMGAGGVRGLAAQGSDWPEGLK